MKESAAKSRLVALVAHHYSIRRTVRQENLKIEEHLESYLRGSELRLVL